MSRSLILSNGSLAIALDEYAQVRDLYYPHAGLEDHVHGHYIHRVGVWTDGAFSWLSDGSWKIALESEADALVSRIVASNERLQVELAFADVVYNEHDIFLRHVVVRNGADREREIRIYFAQQFEIYRSEGSDTAYYDPLSRSVIHYKGRRVFLVGASLEGEPFQEYAIGLAGVQGKEGAYKDAEDGALSKNAIEHGVTDSVVGLYGNYEPHEQRTIAQWIAAAETIEHAHELNSYVLEKGPMHLLHTATDYWRAWVQAYDWHLQGLSEGQAALFRRSMMAVRAHVDRKGGILASLDSDMLQYGNDTYTYVWPRDAAYAALALDAAGDTGVARRFFQFSAATLSKGGYMLHKFLPDRSLGSSWHPWVRDGLPALPIQEDETAIIITTLAKHHARSHDVEFLESMYNPLVKRAAEFMIDHRDPHTRLPLPSYDLWEMKWGTHTYTCACVYGALVASADLAKVLGKRDDETRFRAAAEEVKKAIIDRLWDDASGYFIKHEYKDGDLVSRDTVLDASSAYGIFAFGVLPPDDAKLVRAWEETVRRLSHGIPIGGIARYEHDEYYRSDQESAGNPWIVTTLWYAEYLIARAKNDHDLDHVRDIFAWVEKRALQSGAMAEQFNPQTGAPLSAQPLAWSHAAYVTAVIRYVEKLEALGLCKGCVPVL